MPPRPWRYSTTRVLAPWPGGCDAGRCATGAAADDHDIIAAEHRQGLFAGFHIGCLRAEHASTPDLPEHRRSRPAGPAWAGSPTLFGRAIRLASAAAAVPIRLPTSINSSGRNNRSGLPARQVGATAEDVHTLYAGRPKDGQIDLRRAGPRAALLGLALSCGPAEPGTVSPRRPPAPGATSCRGRSVPPWQTRQTSRPPSGFRGCTQSPGRFAHCPRRRGRAVVWPCTFSASWGCPPDDDPLERLHALRIGIERRSGHPGYDRSRRGIDDHLGLDGLPARAVGHDEAGRFAGAVAQKLGGVTAIQERDARVEERVVEGPLDLHGSGRHVVRRSRDGDLGLSSPGRSRPEAGAWPRASYSRRTSGSGPAAGPQRTAGGPFLQKSPARAACSRPRPPAAIVARPRSRRRRRRPTSKSLVR